MTKPKINYFVDVAMFAVMGSIVFVGLLLGFFLAEGPVSDESTKYFWELHRHQWGDIHLILSLVFVVLLVVHIWLHWGWIRGATRKVLRSGSALAGVLALPVLVTVLAWTATEKNDPAYAGYGVRAGLKYRERLPVEPPLARDRPAKQSSRKVVVTGRMTLQQVEEQTGIPARKIAAYLGLPKDVSATQNLGRLRRQYSFEMTRVRDGITELSGGKIVAVDSEQAGEAHKARPRTGNQAGGGAGFGRGRGKSQGLRQQPINGRMSLGELQRHTGVPAGVILKRLQLPADTPPDARLGRLRRQYGFSMQDVRQIVSASQSDPR